MLRRLEIKTPHRSLAPGFWPKTVPFGKRTVIYGHNGSGKSTLSHLLLEIANGRSPVEVSWDQGDGATAKKIAVGAGLPGVTMSVFTKEWVDKNLSPFLEGNSASAIVTLGEEAIGAKEEEERLEGEVSGLLTQSQEAERKRAEAQRKAESLVREVQTAVVTPLSEFDHETFNRHKWSVRKVSDELTAATEHFPDANDHAEALVRLGEGALSSVRSIDPAPSSVGEALGRLDDLLLETPTRVALAELEGNAAAQHWVEEGRQLHTNVDQCLFCAGPLTPERREDLAKHFDESWLDLRAKARALREELSSYRASLQTWLDSLPETDSLASDLREAYESQLGVLTAEIGARVELLGTVIEAARLKDSDPSLTLSVPDWSELTGAFEVATLEGAVGEHNERAADNAAQTQNHINVVLAHLIGSRSIEYADLVKSAADFESVRATAATAHRLAKRRLDEVRQQKLSSHEMAETLTNDLARVYGKNHLSVTVAPDDKSYLCRRGDQPATNLSTGERTTLSLLYFLRKLEDENDPTLPSQRIVVVDDPSSSLDREAVFATHQWLVDTLARFGQSVVLTHDFSLLRLFIKSQTSQWNKSISEIGKNNKTEILFPRAAFLEVYAASEGDGRTTKIAELPRMLKENTSEYAYLFSMVMKGLEEGADCDRLFLLPNAVRRVLEVFCSYKAPHFPSFDAQLGNLIEMEGSTPAPYRDVYYFCNRYSHGEGAEVVDVLDARAVYHQIRRCMEFLKFADTEHFERMCRAVKCAELV